MSASFAFPASLNPTISFFDSSFPDRRESFLCCANNSPWPMSVGNPCSVGFQMNRHRDSFQNIHDRGDIVLFSDSQHLVCPGGHGDQQIRCDRDSRNFCVGKGGDILVPVVFGIKTKQPIYGQARFFFHPENSRIRFCSLSLSINGIHHSQRTPWIQI